MNKDLMITKQDLIDWIDRQPSNDDLDLATFIATRLEKFYDLENQLQQKENIIKELDKQNEKLGTELSLTTDKYEKKLFIKENIIKEVRKYITSQKLHKIQDTTGGLTYQERKLLEILDKE